MCPSAAAAQSISSLPPFPPAAAAPASPSPDRLSDAWPGPAPSTSAALNPPARAFPPALKRVAHKGGGQQVKAWPSPIFLRLIYIRPKMFKVTDSILLFLFLISDLPANRRPVQSPIWF